MRTLIVVLVFLLVYFLGANLLAQFLINGGYEDTIDNTNGAMVNVNVGEKVDVFVKRTRWYGIIHEEGSTSNLKLFKIANIPIRVNNSSWVIYHFIALVLLTILVLKLNKMEKQKKWESTSDGESSS